jgi:hypothetical protein
VASSKKLKDFGALPCLISWDIWLVRKSMIFEEKFILPFQIISQVRSISSVNFKPAIPKKPRQIKNLDINKSKV